MIKAVPANFTLDELFAHLQAEKQEVAEGYRTSQEWADHFAVTRDVMKGILRQAKDTGLLLCNKVPRERIDGVVARVPAYAFDLSGHEKPGYEDE